MKFPLNWSVKTSALESGLAHSPHPPQDTRMQRSVVMLSSILQCCWPWLLCPVSLSSSGEKVADHIWSRVVTLCILQTVGLPWVVYHKDDGLETCQINILYLIKWCYNIDPDNCVLYPSPLQSANNQRIRAALNNNNPHRILYPNLPPLHTYMYPCL